VPARRSVAEEYHRITKYTPENVSGGPMLDWSRQPSPFKEIVSTRRVPLRDFKEDTRDAAGLPQLGPAQLGRILFHANGVTGILRFEGGGGHFLRASPSAGALYPTEIYAVVRDFDDLEPGIYNYQARTHELVQLWEGDHLDTIQRACGPEARLDGVRACLVLTGLLWRSAWRYHERGYRRVLLDTGHVLANIVAYAPTEGFAAIPAPAFVDAELNGLFFFDEAKEGALVCVPLFEEDEAPPAFPLWPSPRVPTPALRPRTFSCEDDLRESATVSLHCATACSQPAPLGDLPVGIDPPLVSDRSIPLEHAPELAGKMAEAIEARRSARTFGERPISLSDLGRALGFAFGRGEDRAASFPTREAGLLHAHLVARRVAGLEPGLYEIEGAGESLLPISVGDFEQELLHLSLGQEIARSCAAAVVFSAPSDASIEAYGERAYRYLHLEAGGIGERLQLAMTQLGRGACGVGGFFDDEAAALIDIDTEDFILYLVTLGRA